MTTIDIIGIETKISNIAKAQTAIEEIRHLKERFADIQNIQQTISELGAKIDKINSVQAENKGEFKTEINPDLTKFNQARHLLRERITAFSSEKTNKNLLGNKKWKDMLTEIEKTCKTVTDDLNRDWHQFVSGFLGQSTKDIEKAIVLTPEHKNLLRDYDRTYDEGWSHVESFEMDGIINFGKLKTISSKLRTLYDRFDFDIPDYMKEFFEEAAGVSGFDLRKYTPEIQKWLTENKRINSFTIRVRD